MNALPKRVVELTDKERYDVHTSISVSLGHIFINLSSDAWYQVPSLLKNEHTGSLRAILDPATFTSTRQT